MSDLTTQASITLNPSATGRDHDDGSAAGAREVILAPLPLRSQACDPATLSHLRRIVVAVGDQLTTDAVVRVLTRGLPHAEVETLASGCSLRDSLTSRPADLVIAAVSLPDGDVLDLLAEARRRSWCERMLLITERREPQVIQTIRTLGAHGALDSQVDGVARLYEAIRRIGCGGTFWSSTFVEILRGEGPHGYVQRTLSPAELYVFAILGDGCDDQMAALELSLSTQAVHAFRKRLHFKLGLQHKGQLVSLAVRCGLVRFTPTGVERPGLEALRLRSVFRPRRRSLVQGGTTDARQTVQKRVASWAK